MTFIWSKYPLKARQRKIVEKSSQIFIHSKLERIESSLRYNKDFISSKIQTNELMLGWQSFEAEKIDQQQINKFMENSYPPAGLCKVFLELFRNRCVDVSFRLLPCDPTVLQSCAEKIKLVVWKKKKIVCFRQCNFKRHIFARPPDHVIFEPPHLPFDQLHLHLPN